MLDTHVPYLFRVIEARCDMVYHYTCQYRLRFTSTVKLLYLWVANDADAKDPIEMKPIAVVQLNKL